MALAIAQSNTNMVFGTTAVTSGTSAVLATGATAGRALVLYISFDKASGTVNTPTGWAPIGQQSGASVSIAVFGKVAAGGETSVAFTWTTAALGYATVLMELSGAAASPFGGIHLPAYSDTARTSMTLDPPAATAAGWALAFFGNDTAPVGTFNVTATGWATAVQANYATATGGPAATVLQRSVASGEDIASTTFSWSAPSDQTAGIAFLLYESATAEPVTPTLLHRVVGIPTGTVGRVAVRTSNAASVRLKVGTDSAVTTGVIYGPAVIPNAQGGAQLTAPGLTPGTVYYYRVAMTPSGGTETLDTAATVGKFKTAPSEQADFAFNFASCTNATDSASLAAIAARNDDLFFHLGDLYYADGSGTGLQNFRDKMNAKIEAPNHAAVFATTPMTYTPSDHDGMANNSGAGDNATGWTNWNTAYRELFPSPVVAGTGAYFTFVWGRVRFIQIDTRSFKSSVGATDDANKTALGATQKQWLKDTITAATEPVIVIIQADPWVGVSSDGDDTWGYYNTERTELASFFVASGKRIGMLGGDMHAVAADDGTNAPGGIFVFQAAPLNNVASVKGGPYSVPPYPASGTATVQQYGRCVVTDTGNTIALAFTGYSSDNTARVALTKTYTLATGTVVDVWNGTALVRQRIDRWNGTALVQQQITP